MWCLRKHGVFRTRLGAVVCTRVGRDRARERARHRHITFRAEAELNAEPPSHR